MQSIIFLSHFCTLCLLTASTPTNPGVLLSLPSDPGHAINLDPLLLKSDVGGDNTIARISTAKGMQRKEEDGLPDRTDNSIIEMRIPEIRRGDPNVQTIKRHLRNKRRSFPTPPAHQPSCSTQKQRKNALE
jgi:hypothetical protein